MGFVITAALQVLEVGIILGKQDWTNIMKEDTFRLHHIYATSVQSHYSREELRKPPRFVHDPPNPI